MIVMEGRRFKADHEPLEFNDNRRSDDAINGSAMLRDAILRSMGVEPQKQPAKPKPIKPAAAHVAHEPARCAHCGAPKAPKSGIIQHIQRTVASYYGVHPNSMTSADRRHSVAHPRQTAMLLCTEFTNKSLAEIGRRFGGRDHTTVIWALEATARRAEADVELALDLETLRERLAA